jgi:hypothetical protein
MLQVDGLFYEGMARDDYIHNALYASMPAAIFYEADGLKARVLAMGNEDELARFFLRARSKNPDAHLWMENRSGHRLPFAVGESLLVRPLWSDE